MVLKMPSKVVLVLGLVAGALVALNQTTFDFGEPWKEAVNLALILIPAFGVGPLVGDAWKTALHLTPGEVAAVGGVLTVLQVLNEQDNAMWNGWHAILGGIMAFAAAVGFGPLAKETVLTARSTRA